MLGFFLITFLKQMDIQLRPLQSSYAKDLALHANNIKIASNLTDQFPHPYSIDNANQFIGMMMGKLHLMCCALKLMES
ncbi:MAG: glutathionylspermidine synthase [Bacteroidia bacterium]|jgi:glutathionylspermidine synthase